MSSTLGQPYFQTSNTPLAVTLATCGVPRGEPFFLNYYDREKLVQLGYRGSGLSIDEAAMDAWRNGRPGIIVYNFIKEPPFHEVLRSFDRHASAIDKANAGGPRGGVAMTVLDVTPDVAAAICAQFAANRRRMLEDWRTEIPWVLVPGPVETVHEGGKVYKMGSMKLYRAGASAETKAKIGL